MVKGLIRGDTFWLRLLKKEPLTVNVKLWTCWWSFPRLRIGWKKSLKYWLTSLKAKTMSMTSGSTYTSFPPIIRKKCKPSGRNKLKICRKFLSFPYVRQPPDFFVFYITGNLSIAIMSTVQRITPYHTSVYRKCLPRQYI